MKRKVMKLHRFQENPVKKGPGQVYAEGDEEEPFTPQPVGQVAEKGAQNRPRQVKGGGEARSRSW